MEKNDIFLELSKKILKKIEKGKPQTKNGKKINVHVDLNRVLAPINMKKVFMEDKDEIVVIGRTENGGLRICEYCKDGQSNIRTVLNFENLHYGKRKLSENELGALIKSFMKGLKDEAANRRTCTQN